MTSQVPRQLGGKPLPRRNFARNLAILIIAFFLLGYMVNDICEFLFSRMPKGRLNPNCIPTNEGFLCRGNDFIYTDFLPTGSMFPLFTKGHLGVYTTDFDVEDLQVGDIVIVRRPRNFLDEINDKLYCWLMGIEELCDYSSDYEEYAHRIIFIGHDSNGWFAVTKGDTNPLPDFFMVREENVVAVMIAIIY